MFGLSGKGSKHDIQNYSILVTCWHHLADLWGTRKSIKQWYPKSVPDGAKRVPKWGHFWSQMEANSRQTRCTLFLTLPGTPRGAILVHVGTIVGTSVGTCFIHVWNQFSLVFYLFGVGFCWCFVAFLLLVCTICLHCVHVLWSLGSSLGLLGSAGTCAAIVVRNWWEVMVAGWKSWVLLVTIGKGWGCWTMWRIILSCWQVLGIAGDRWEALGFLGNCWDCWQMLAIAWTCWTVLGTGGNCYCLNLLETVGECWELLGNIGSCLVRVVKSSNFFGSVGKCWE